MSSDLRSLARGWVGRSLLLITAIMIVSSSWATAGAQVIAPSKKKMVTSSSGMIFAPGKPVAGQGPLGAGGSPGSAVVPPAPTPRQQKLQQAAYDRRPSTILLNWSRPFDPELVLLAQKQKAAAMEAQAKAAAEAQQKAANPSEKEAGKKAESGAKKSTSALTPTKTTTSTASAPAVKTTVAVTSKTPAMAKMPAGGSTTKSSAVASATPSSATGAAPKTPSDAVEKSAVTGGETKQNDGKKGETKKPEDAKPDPIDIEILTLQRNVSLGNWPAVKAYFAKVTKEEAKAGYRQLLTSLRNPPNGPPIPLPPDVKFTPAPQTQFAERNLILLDDFLGLSQASPAVKEEEDIEGLAGLLTLSIENGVVVESAVAALKTESSKPAGQGAVTIRDAAKLLEAANLHIHLVGFLPPVEKATADKDLEALNLLARYSIALTNEDRKPEHLEKAWTITQAVIAFPSAAPGATGDAKAKEAALLRAVDLASKIRKQLGQTWLDQSFTSKADRGMQILAAVGSLSSRGMQTHPHDIEMRLKTLELQQSAVAALIKAAPAKTAEWKSTLHLLASVWLREAEYSKTNDQSTSYGPRMQRDNFGNIFFMGEQSQQRNYTNPNMPAPISVGEILRIRPHDAWLAAVDPQLRLKLDLLAAQLLLKVNEEKQAFPYIERIARSNPVQGKELVEEYLGVWTNNHDPNSSRRYTNPYMYMYGFERRSEGIPLTRSKQERNLEELTLLVTQLKTLPIGDFKEDLLSRAFTTCHSSAEVFKLDAIQKVFGPIEKIKPKTLAGLAQVMRTNLTGIWRLPAEQEKAKTNRKTKDIQAEVVRGYLTANQVVDDAIAKFPTEWSLVCAKAALMHDEANYEREIAKSPSFSPKRLAALAAFQKAADLYAAVAPKLRADEVSTEVYELWFYAGLGACDLGQIAEDAVADVRTPKLIAAAIGKLEGEAAEVHRSRFANLLFNRMSSVKPGAKYQYLDSGFQIVGDHKAAVEAKKVADYYRDLVREVRLEAVVDGDSEVGSAEPFGVFVNIRHTREIEREAGGFGKYLQNQNSYGFSYNWGRPIADYRDRFQESINEALKEHFEVMSVTFQDEKVHSRAVEEYGWRTTPYAYLLLKPRGQQVDRLPTLRLDLDFLDTSGYVVLPIRSPVLTLSCKGAGHPRPVADLRVIQTLDERQASQGKLTLEIRASANGLIGPLAGVAEISKEGFKPTKIHDQGVSINKFAESDQLAIASERIWNITYEADGEAVKTFAFGTPVQGAVSTLQRYSDADLIPAEAVVSLERSLGQNRPPWMVWSALGVGGLLILGFAAFFFRRKAAKPADATELSGNLTPFAVFALLQRVGRSPSLQESERRALEADVAELERRFFANGSATNGTGENGSEINGADIRRMAVRWVEAGKRASATGS